MSSTKLCDKRVLNTCRRRVLSYCKMGGGEIKNPLQFYFCAVTGKKCQPDHRLENAPFCFNKLIFPPFVLPIRRTFFSTLYPPTNELEKTKYNSQLLLKLPDVAAAQFSVVCALHYTTLHYTILHYTTLHSLHYTTSHYIILHYNTLYYTTLYYIVLHYITLRYTTLRYATLHYTTLHYTVR